MSAAIRDIIPAVCVAPHRRRRRFMAAAAAGGKLARDRRGAVAVEYGFLIALVVIGVLFAVRALGGANFDIWTNVSEKVTRA